MASSQKRLEDSAKNNDGEKKEKDKTESNPSASSDTPTINSNENVVVENNSTTPPEEPDNKTQKKYQMKKSKKSEKKNSKDLKIESIDCSVCLGTPVFPTSIPCGHIFCFLCLKGVARRSDKCPLCRQPIPPDFDKNPTVLEKHDIETLDDGFQWFYEGKNGWWLYEKRTSEEIEQNFKLNKMKFDLLICGTMYTIDLDRNVQFNKENPTRRRKIKRENAENVTVKGVAGVH